MTPLYPHSFQFILLVEILSYFTLIKYREIWIYLSLPLDCEVYEGRNHVFFFFHISETERKLIEFSCT